VGFKHWHPVAVTADGGKLAGQAELGGVWEWTSSVLERHEGFEAMPLYPAYTGTSHILSPQPNWSLTQRICTVAHVYAADFFDGKHNIVLGGSWATHPRIAGRKTL
jgi:L-histidine Nalpha-methyltransferase / hercynylcysteine S-oxide synthase